MSITEFLLARITEDERQAKTCRDLGWFPGKKYELTTVSYARILAECEAKRAIIKQHEAWPTLIEGELEMEPVSNDIQSMTYRASRQIAWLTEQEYIKCFGVNPPTAPMIATLAAIYSDHPDYRQEWKP